MSTAFGLSACAVSSFCFGTMYVAVRRAGSPGDGMVVQWMVCSAVFLVGLCTYIATGAPPFQPFAMIGGALWAFGNLTAIPIINAIGLGMGILIWGVCNCVVGWATGRFGLFGVKASIPNSPIMNFTGLFFVITGGVLFALVRPKTVVRSAGDGSSTLQLPAQSQGLTAPPIDEADTEQGTAEERAELVGQVDEQAEDEQVVTTSTVVATDSRVEVEAAQDRINNNNPHQQMQKLKERIIAIALSVFAGICYGSTFTPVIYMQDNPDKFDRPPKDAIYYVFSHFAGVYLTSSAVLFIYIGYKNNRPYVDNRLLFPALLAGILWAVAMLAWFVANDLLSQAITFPINAMAPGVIASLWSVLYFREIERKDLKLLAAAMLVTIFGVMLVGLSKMT